MSSGTSGGMSNDRGSDARSNLGTALRELGDDGGLPVAPSEDILAVAKRTQRQRRAVGVGECSRRAWPWRRPCR